MTRHPHGRLSGRLLVVEDNVALSALLQTVLEGQGCEVGIASDLAGALALSAGTRWTAAVLDIDLPDGNGIDLLSRLRGCTQSPHLPAVFMTGRADAARLRRIDDLGYALCLPKPFRFSQLTAALAAVVAAARVDPLHGGGSAP